jgi:hypothetical protein
MIPACPWAPLFHNEILHNEILHEGHHLERRREAVVPSFTLSAGLALKLLATDIGGLRPGDVHLPYKQFEIHPPKGLPLRYCYFGVLDCGEFSAVYPKAAEELRKHGWDPATTLEVYDMDLGRMTYLRKDARLRDQGLNEEQFNFAQFVLNLCLFLETTPSSMRLQNADTIERLERGQLAKRSTTKERLARLRASRAFDVGTDIAVDPRLQEGLFTNGPGWKLCYRTMVRGHWRNQAHGEGRTQRKMRWIEPHIRGTDGPLMQHNYDIQPSRDLP